MRTTLPSRSPSSASCSNDAQLLPNFLPGTSRGNSCSLSSFLCWQTIWRMSQHVNRWRSADLDKSTIHGESVVSTTGARNVFGMHQTRRRILGISNFIPGYVVSDARKSRYEPLWFQQESSRRPFCVVCFTDNWNQIYLDIQANGDCGSLQTAVLWRKCWCFK